jgi:hypothetical protein
MADTNKGQNKNPEQQCYTSSEEIEPGEYYRSFVRDPRTVFEAAPQMPDPVRGLSDNLDQLCYPTEAPMSITSYIPEGEAAPLPSFTFTSPSDLCKWIPDLCDKLPKTFSIDFNGIRPRVSLDGEPTGGDDGDPTEWNFEQNACIQNAIECIFKPFAQNGGWLPTASDCDTFYPPGFNRNPDNKTCILNCVPDRIPVYELRYSGSDAADYYYTIDPNEVPSGYIKTRPTAVGGSVASLEISLAESDGYYQQGSWELIEIDKTYVNEAGSRWWPNLPKKKYQGRFRIGNKGAVANMIIAATEQDGDWDTRYVLLGFESLGDGYVVGEIHELRTQDSSNTLLGYVRISEVTSQQPLFYVLRNQADVFNNNVVALCHLYSPSRQDSFLTTDMAGEAQRINEDGYEFRGVLGYVLKNKDNADDYLCEGEQLSPLYRYYQGGYTGMRYADHRYSTIPLATNEKFNTGDRRLFYKIPFNPFTPLIIRYKAQRGDAGKKSSWGYYFANESGIPQLGRILRKNMTDSVASEEIEIATSALANYPNGYVGFFMIADGNLDSNISDGSMITFTQVSISGDIGYQAYFNGNLVYARSGVPGNAHGGSNYVFFSDNELNPNQRVFTRWSGKIQGWEDWVGGDEDYDDMRVDYDVQWKGGTNYAPEGIQCYLFKDDILPKVYMTTQVRVGCEADRLFKNSFRDPIIKRLGCGSAVDGTYLPGTCTGSYVIQSNCDQSITCRMDGNITLLSWGCDVQNEFKDTSWRIRFTRNGEYILDEVYSARTFPKKGRTLHPTFNVAVGDTLRFELLEVLSGSPNGMIFPKVSLYDELNQIHESVINMTINTKSMDSTTYTTSTTNDGTRIKQLRIESLDGTESVIGYDNNTTQQSLTLDIGDTMWRKLNQDERNNPSNQRITSLFIKSGKGTNGPIDASIQVRFEPILGVNNKYQTKVTIEQLVIRGRGFAVGDQLEVSFPDSMYIGTTRIPENKKLKIKLIVTGVS